MKQIYGLRLVVAALLLLLIVAGGIAIFTFSFARIFFTNENALRLDPLGLSVYPHSPIPTLANTKRLVFFGDSRAETWPPPTNLPAWEFINRGISGQTTAQILGRFDAHIAPLQPQVIVLQLGINDLRDIPMFPASRANLIATTVANIQTIIRQSNDLGATIILTTIFPVTEPSIERRLFFWSDDIGRAAHEANQRLRTLTSDRVIILDADALLSDSSGLARTEYMEDTLHLNLAGYDLLNQHLSSILNNLP